MQLILKVSRSRSIDTKECIANKLKGQCMFSFECMQHKGKSIGICIEQYYIGSCCYFNSSDVDEELLIINNDKQQNRPISLVESGDNIISSLTSQQNIPNSSLVSNEKVLFIKKVTSNHFQNQTDATPVNNTSNTTRTTSIGLYSSQTSNDNLLVNKSNSTRKISTSVENANDTSDSDKTNYLKQKKPINLIDHQEAVTTSNFDTKDIIKFPINEFSHTYNLADANSTDYTNSTLEPSINNSLETNKLIDKNLTDSQLISEPSIDSIKNATTLSPLILSTQSPIEKYFMNQGLIAKIKTKMI